MVEGALENNEMDFLVHTQSAWPLILTRDDRCNRCHFGLFMLLPIEFS